LCTSRPPGGSISGEEEGTLSASSLERRANHPLFYSKVTGKDGTEGEEGGSLFAPEIGDKKSPPGRPGRAIATALGRLFLLRK